MCLVKVREEQDVVVPYRRVTRRSPSPPRRITRVSRTSIVEQRPSSVRIPAPVQVPIPPPQPSPIPPPQPAPVFVQPPPPPPPPPQIVVPSVHRETHYVEVSPRSSMTSHSDRHSDYYVRERVERRERREYSPARSDYSRGDRSPRYQTYQYVEAPEPERHMRRERSRSRARSRSRDYRHEPDDVYRTTRERVIISNDGRRSREYRDYRH